MKSRICVFTGPTISAADARLELDALYRPPAAQGDVYRAALDAPLAIAIIDGYFETVPAVWHKEVLWAMSRGVHVYGGASMGALRAAELADFGMIGVGAVFTAYRDGVLTDDDEVAIRVGPAETGYRALSEAMVNIRATLHAAEAAGVVTSKTRLALERLAKTLYYPERSYAALLIAGRDTGIADTELRRLHEWLPAGRIDLKRDDAIALLRVMRDHRADRLRARAPATFEFQHTVLWDRVVRSIRTSRRRKTTTTGRTRRRKPSPPRR